VSLGGVPIDQVDRAAAALLVRKFFESGLPHQIVTVNLDHLAKARTDSAFRRAIAGADLVVADGMPLLWVSRLRGQPLPERVTGFDVVDQACRVASQAGRGVFLLGSTDEVLQEASSALVRQHPGLQVATYSPPFGTWPDVEHQRIIGAVQEANPGFLFVALGAPRQETWTRDHLQELNVPVVVGVGAVLDALAGVVQRAPVWAQRRGLEWAFRLAQEPGRLWRRYLVDDVPMLGRLIVESFRYARE
jgi:N-acetylglucosaminyldiphosphoundecaprenol N-acetyl-beta-D-mannosaminyltransferase